MATALFLLAMSSPQTVSKETILVIDDQEPNRVILDTLLTMTGHEVVSANSGAEALQVLETCTPDLILLDVLMPDVNGIEVCRKIKANALWVDVPVIFLSAADDKNLIVEALECGGVDYVTKPFNKAELLSRVRTHLALRRAREELRHLAEDKDELLGILTHDLGNHLSGVRMSAAVLEKQMKDLPSQCAPVVQNIVNSTEVMTTFVREFLANQSAERLQVNIEPTDLKPLLEAAVDRHKLIAESKKIALHLEFSAEPVHAQADEEALASV
ncbi:MAG: response regulator receiver sensor signal transduction histidine kinase, partial [Prosthecobacter sp.]|nr:response regulator receiver sensor signal transduction histidine kinase [Prosthecobacter sp.]